jgi:hypothetical protein
VNVNCSPNLTLDILLMNSEYYFYILICDDGSKYYGHTRKKTIEELINSFDINKMSRV